MSVVETIVRPQFDGVGTMLARDVAASMGLIAPGEKAAAMEKALRLVIASGELTERRLPSISDLAATLGVTPKRVQSAYRILAAEGRIVETAEGWCVAPDAWAGSVRRSSFARRDLALTPMATASDLFPAEGWLRLHERATKEYGPGAFRSGPPGGVSVAKRALAGLLAARLGFEVEPGCIAIVSSRARALEIALSVTSGFGNEIWIEDPGDPTHQSVIRRLHRRAVPVRLDSDGLVLADGEALAPVARAVLVSGAGQYPLAIEYTDARRAELAGWARSADAWIVEDWHHCEAAIGRVVRSGVDYANTVRVGSLDGISFGGVALAWIAAPPRLLAQITAELEEADETPSVELQCTLASSIETGFLQTHLARLAAARTERLDALERGVLAGARRFARIRVDRHGLHACMTLPRGVEEAPLVAELTAAGLGVVGLRRMRNGGSGGEGGLVLGWCGTPARRTNSAALVMSEIYNRALARAGLTAGRVPLGHKLRIHTPALRG